MTHHTSLNNFSALLAVGLVCLIALTSSQNTRGDQINSPTSISYADHATQNQISCTENDTGDGSGSRSKPLSTAESNSPSLSEKWIASTHTMNSIDCMQQVRNTVNEPHNPATANRHTSPYHKKLSNTWRNTDPSSRKQSTKDTHQATHWHVT